MANTRNRSQSQSRSQTQRRGSSRNPNAMNQNYPDEYWDYADYYYEGNPQYTDYGTQQMQNQGTDYGNMPVWVIEEYWWAVPGPNTGKGPKGFERSDQDIEKEVNHRLAQNGQLDASTIDVKVNDCEVTLTGDVNSRQDKRLAEDIADSVFGVQDVHNQLHLNKQGQTQPMGVGQMSTGAQPSNLRKGQRVVGSKGKEVGTVKDVSNNEFTVNRPMAVDVRIPFSAIRDTTDQEIRLNVPADQVDNQGWKHV